MMNHEPFEVQVKLNNGLELQFLPNSKHTPSPYKKSNWLTVFRETITAYSKNHTKHKYTVDKMQSF